MIFIFIKIPDYIFKGTEKSLCITSNNVPYPITVVMVIERILLIAIIRMRVRMRMRMMPMGKKRGKLIMICNAISITILSWGTMHRGAG